MELRLKIPYERGIKIMSTRQTIARLLRAAHLHMNSPLNVAAFVMFPTSIKAVFHSAKKTEQIENSSKCLRRLNTIVQYQKTEQKKLAGKKVENFQLSWLIF